MDDISKTQFVQDALIALTALEAVQAGDTEKANDLTKHITATERITGLTLIATILLDGFAKAQGSTPQEVIDAMRLNLVSNNY
jgi:hypothetical protein